jgi:hypothetical protein
MGPKRLVTVPGPDNRQAGRFKLRVSLTALPPSLPGAKIYRFLEGKGPCKALQIAQGLGMRTASDVNPDLYKMKKLQLLSHDQHLNVWDVSRSGRPGLLSHPASGAMREVIHPNTLTAGGSAEHLACSPQRRVPLGTCHRLAQALLRLCQGRGGPREKGAQPRASWRQG